MAKFVMGLGVVIILIGLWLLFFPNQFGSVANWESRQGLYLAAGGRVATGLILLLSASSTRYPRGFRIFGGVILLIGLGLPFVPMDIWVSMIQWWLVNLSNYNVGVGIVAMLLGAFFVHAALPEKPDA